MVSIIKLSLIPNIKNKFLDGNVLDTSRLFLRLVSIQDCKQSYVDWLNDPRVNGYLETRWENQTLSSVKTFVEQQRLSNNTFLFGIFLKADDKHIGNIKLGPIIYPHNCASISFFIGDVSEWGKGYTTEAINSIKDFAFKSGISRLEAGLYCENLGSFNALRKNGFVVEGVQKNRLYIDGKWQDCILLGVQCSERSSLKSSP